MFGWFRPRSLLILGALTLATLLGGCVYAPGPYPGYGYYGGGPYYGGGVVAYGGGWHGHGWGWHDWH